MDEFFPVVEGDPASRNAARQAAEARATQLSADTDFDHEMRWDRDARHYVVFEVPFEAPAEPWSETNEPHHRPPNWTRSKTRTVGLADLLVECAGLASFQWLTCSERPADPARFVADLQASLDMQYGRGRFWACRHGSRIYLQCRRPVGR